MYEVLREACVWITLKDTERLAAKLWTPVTKIGKENEKFPAILGKITHKRELQQPLNTTNKTGLYDLKHCTGKCAHRTEFRHKSLVIFIRQNDNVYD